MTYLEWNQLHLCVLCDLQMSSTSPQVPGEPDIYLLIYSLSSVTMLSVGKEKIATISKSLLISISDLYNMKNANFFINSYNSSVFSLNILCLCNGQHILTIIMI